VRPHIDLQECARKQSLLPCLCVASGRWIGSKMQLSMYGDHELRSTHCWVSAPAHAANQQPGKCGSSSSTPAHSPARENMHNTLTPQRLCAAVTLHKGACFSPTRSNSNAGNSTGGPHACTQQHTGTPQPPTAANNCWRAPWGLEGSHSTAFAPCRTRGSDPRQSTPLQLHPHLCELDGRWLPLLAPPGLPRVAHARIIAVHAIHRRPSALARVHVCWADAPASSTNAAAVQTGTAPAHHWFVRTRKASVAAWAPSMHRDPPQRVTGQTSRQTDGGEGLTFLPPVGAPSPAGSDAHTQLSEGGQQCTQRKTEIHVWCARRERPSRRQRSCCEMCLLFAVPSWVVPRGRKAVCGACVSVPLSLPKPCIAFKASCFCS
jgi:hypothetical protein